MLSEKIFELQYHQEDDNRKKIKNQSKTLD